MQLSVVVLPTLERVAEGLGGLELLKANGENALGLLVEQDDVCDIAVFLGSIAHVFLNLEDGGVVVDEVGELERVLDDDDLSPLVFLDSEALLDFLLVVGPLGEFARSC